MSTLPAFFLLLLLHRAAPAAGAGSCPGIERGESCGPAYARSVDTQVHSTSHVNFDRLILPPPSPISSRSTRLAAATTSAAREASEAARRERRCCQATGSLASPYEEKERLQLQPACFGSHPCLKAANHYGTNWRLGRIPIDFASPTPFT